MRLVQVAKGRLKIEFFNVKERKMYQDFFPRYGEFGTLVYRAFRRVNPLDGVVGHYRPGDYKVQADRFVQLVLNRLGNGESVDEVFRKIPTLVAQSFNLKHCIENMVTRREIITISEIIRAAWKEMEEEIRALGKKEVLRVRKIRVVFRGMEISDDGVIPVRRSLVQRDPVQFAKAN